MTTQIASNLPLRILFATMLNPWGTGGGNALDRLYINSLLELFPRSDIHILIYDRYLSAAQHAVGNNSRVHLHPVVKRPLSQRFGSLITGVTHRFSTPLKQLLKQQQFDFFFLQNSRSSAGLWGLLDKYKLPGIVVHHNHEPEYFRYDVMHPVMRKIYMPHVRRAERQSYYRASLNLFLTEDDRQKFISTYGATSSPSEIGGLFEATDYLPHTAPLPTTQALAITGSLNNPQNHVGIEYFFAELYPHIPSDLKIIIAGQNPSERLRQLCAAHTNVQLIPNPENMDEVINTATIALCPMPIGGGIKVRITDPLRCGRAVLTPRISLRGYEAMQESRGVTPFDTPADFFQKLSRLLESPPMPETIVKAYRENFSHSAGLTRLNNALTRHILNHRK